MKKSSHRSFMPVSSLRQIICLGFLVSVVCLDSIPATAQEALQNASYGREAATDRAQQLQNQQYTVKYGDFRLLVSPYAGMEWNDNVNLSQTNKQSDFIARGGVHLSSSYPFTEQNVLFLDITIGYDRYLKYPSYSTFDLNSSSGTGLSFDIGIKDVDINLHDWVSYVQDASQNGSVANTAKYGTFQNTIGLAAVWHLNRANLSAGYDNQYVRSTSSDFDNINHDADLLFLRAGWQVHPQWTVGVESTAGYTRYEQNTLNNNSAYTLGAYTDFTPDTALKVTARAGFSTYQFDNTSSTVTTSDQNSWYADLTVVHNFTEAVGYSLSGGHQVQLGTQSDLTEVDYVRPTINWNIIKDWPFTTGFFYEHGNEGVGNVVGNNTQQYNWYGGTFNVSRDFSKHFSGSLYYRFTARSSNSSNTDYTQNLVGLQISYHP